MTTVTRLWKAYGVTARRRSIFSVVILFATGTYSVPGRSETVSLSDLLDRTGSQVERFWRQFTSVSATETVEQVKVDEKGKIVNRREAAYDYIIFMQLTGKAINVAESRKVNYESKPKKVRRPSNRPLLVTSGFPIMLLVFHPQFQDRYVFTSAGIEPSTADSKSLYRVEFEQVIGAESLSVLRLKVRDHPIAWRGVAWIEPESGLVVRVQTGLREPVEELGLESLVSDVHYSAVSFQGTAESFWLPDRARVEAATLRQHWRNEHRFTGYKRFAVSTEVSIGGVE